MADATTFYDIAQIIAKDFRVPDVLTPTSSCIFLLESPHVQELKHGSPVAGPSGATMSKHIFGPNYGKIPLGLLMKARAEQVLLQSKLNAIGLMNVSPFPLQKIAYGENWARDVLEQWFDDMAVVRTVNQKDTYANPRQNEIQDWLVHHLRARLAQFEERSTTFIPCGRFAQKFMRIVGVHDSNWHIIWDVPHPSYRSWDRERYQAQVSAVRRAVERAASEIEPS